ARHRLHVRLVAAHVKTDVVGLDRTPLGVGDHTAIKLGALVQITGKTALAGVGPGIRTINKIPVTRILATWRTVREDHHVVGFTFVVHIHRGDILAIVTDNFPGFRTDTIDITNRIVNGFADIILGRTLVIGD